MTLLESLWFLLLIIVHHLILTNIRNNKLLVLDDGPSDDVNGSVGTAEKKFSINFSKEKTKVSLSLHYNDDGSFLFFKRKRSL